MSGKFVIGDHVRVIDQDSSFFDTIGRAEDFTSNGLWGIRLDDGERWWWPEALLTLADPDMHTVLDQMDAESADPVSAPSHYRSHPSGIETIQITRHESFLRGNVLKYVLRAPYKGSEIEDLKKAAQYLQWEIDRAEAAQ